MWFLPLHNKKVAQSLAKKLSFSIKHAIYRNAKWNKCGKLILKC